MLQWLKPRIKKQCIHFQMILFKVMSITSQDFYWKMTLSEISAYYLDPNQRNLMTQSESASIKIPLRHYKYLTDSLLQKAENIRGSHLAASSLVLLSNLALGKDTYLVLEMMHGSSNDALCLPLLCPQSQLAVLCVRGWERQAVAAAVVVLLCFLRRQLLP